MGEAALSRGRRGGQCEKLPSLGEEFRSGDSKSVNYSLSLNISPSF